jgi:hypothetical protein
MSSPSLHGATLPINESAILLQVVTTIGLSAVVGSLHGLQTPVCVLDECQGYQLIRFLSMHHDIHRTRRQ